MHIAVLTSLVHIPKSIQQSIGAASKFDPLNRTEHTVFIRLHKRMRGAKKKAYHQ
jgi:hypothetical protein